MIERNLSVIKTNPLIVFFDQRWVLVKISIFHVFLHDFDAKMIITGENTFYKVIFEVL